MNHAQAVPAIIDGLKALYPEAICSLHYEKDYELLFAVRLSAQCTDARVNLVTPALFQRFPTLEAFAEADPAEVGEYIHSCGFHNSKSKDLVACAKMLLERFDGKVPQSMEDLTSLPGIGRKTANLIRGDIFQEPGSVVADTHCIRITGRLGLTDGTKDPAKVEKQLRAVLPPEESSDFCHRMVLFGRDICVARKPKCERCPLTAWCKAYQET
jgi:endonuclease-3